MSTNPMIYIACLASYNNGILFGKWINAAQDEDSINAEIHDMLSQSPIPHAEEWAIHDYDGFGSYPLDEYESISTICEIAAFIVEHGELGIELMANVGCNVEEAREILENNSYGTYDSELDFATELFNECYAHEIPEHLRHYIDYEAFCRDLFINDYYSIRINGDVHIFSNY